MSILSRALSLEDQQFTIIDFFAGYKLKYFHVSVSFFNSHLNVSMMSFMVELSHQPSISEATNVNKLITEGA